MLITGIRQAVEYMSGNMISSELSKIVEVAAVVEGFLFRYVCSIPANEICICPEYR